MGEGVGGSGSVGKPSDDRPLNNLSALADLGRRISALPSSTPSASGFGNLLGVFPPIQAPVSEPIPPPAPAAPDLDFIRKFVGAMVTKKALVKDGRVMPAIDDLAIMEGRRVNAAFVYSDMHGFTKLIATQPENKSFAFLHTFVEIASRLTKYHEGQVVDCAGDRVLSVFHRSPGDHSVEQVHDTINFALYLQTAFDRVIGPSFAAGALGQLSLGIGIDYGEAIVGCVGIRGGKKIIFLGEPANKAAKLQEKAGACETVLSYDAAVRMPAYLNISNGWNFRQEKIEDGSSILRTTCVFKYDQLARVR
jgi:class 3 adenylate cyclase